MAKINRAAIDRLPAEKQADARRLLEELESRYRSNPLLRYRPHDKQKEFHAARTRLKGMMGGNRSGKTTAGVLDDIIQACDESAVPDHLKEYKKFDPPFHCRIVCPSNDIMESVVFQKLREWVPRGQLVGDKWDKAFSKSQRILHFKNGSFFDFLTYEQDLDKHSGAAKHRVHFDEEPPFRIWQEGSMRIIDYKGADLLLTMTPLLGLSWAYDVIWAPWEKGTLQNGKIVVVDMDDNPHLDEEQKEMALAGLSREERKARKEGRFVHFEGMIYPEFVRHQHVMPEHEIPSGAPVWVGIDPGFRNMAAVVWLYITPEGTAVVFDELALQGSTVAQVARAIKEINLKHGSVVGEQRVPIVPRAYVIDPSARNKEPITGRSVQMEFIDHGIVSIPGQNDVAAGVNRVKERLQSNHLKVTANCPELIDEFRKYRWARQSRGDSDPKEAPVKTDDHLLDALRYVLMARPAAPVVEKNAQDMTPVQQLMQEEVTGKSYRKNKPVYVSGIPV